MTNRHRKSQSLWQAGETALAALTTHSRYDVETLFHCFDMTTSARKRRVILKQLAIILQCWHKSDLQPHFGSLKKLLHGAVHESRPLVRKDARATFCAFADMWLEHLDELVVLLSPAACQALRNEHPTARLSLALGKPTTTRIVDRNICVNDPEDPPETLVSDAALDDTPRLQEQLQRAQAQLKTLKRERAIERATWHMTEASMLDHLETLKYRLFKAQDDAIQVEKSLRHQLKTVQKALLQTKMCLPHETLGEPSDTASDDGSWTDTDDNFVHHDRVQVLKQRVEMSLFSPRDCLLTEPKDVVQSNPQPNESEPQDVQPPPSTQPARPYWIAAMSAAACAGAFFVASRWSK
ncbi:hypothetical protein AC1031_009273 [Aphanomyces cochlioides]|nr:hypothetical protein AC1031_009273 [Aphanomyces cochlioides]